MTTASTQEPTDAALAPDVFYAPCAIYDVPVSRYAKLAYVGLHHVRQSHGGRRWLDVAWTDDVLPLRLMLPALDELIEHRMVERRHGRRSGYLYRPVPPARWTITG